MSVYAYCNYTIIQYYMHSFCKITYSIKFQTFAILNTIIMQCTETIIVPILCFYNNNTQFTQYYANLNYK